MKTRPWRKIKLQTNKGWGWDQAEEFLYRVTEKMGQGWSVVGPELQRALIAQEILRVIKVQITPIDAEELIQLQRQMETVAGLISVDDWVKG